MGPGTKRGLGIVGVVAFASLGVGCSDDEPAEPISAAEYAVEVAEICAQHGEALAEAAADLGDGTRSDSERIAYYRTDYVPRVRTIINELANRGFPVDHDAEYRAILNEVLSLAQRFENEAPQFIDDQRAGRLEDVDNFPVLIQQGLAAAEIRCVG